MKSIVLTALNTRHTHSALGLIYIKTFREHEHPEHPLQLLEFDLNQTNESIIADLIAQKPDILAFSVYIWSVARTLVIAGALKAAFPKLIVILGGPEVSFNSEEIMARCQAIDFIVRGEGEVTFSRLLDSLLDGTSPVEIEGLTRRENGQVVKNPDRDFIRDLDIIPSPFRSGIYKEVHSFTYYEASRGCPSRCTYCLSSVLGPVRNHSIARVKADLDWFFDSDYQQVRFADRTFNFDHGRACEIISYIKANNHRNINFHFEIQADFLSEAIIELLSDAPDGMFHLEIGIQSTHPEALQAVNRRFNLDILRERIALLKNRTRCHLHLDLLGALPFDTFKDFCRSFNDVWELSPHSIQISLVKVLSGTPLQRQLADGDLAAMPEPPYTVLRTTWLAADEAMLIQDIGKLVEGMHNSGRFAATLRLIIFNNFAGSAAAMYHAMAIFWRRKRFQFFNFSPENMAKHLAAFLADCSHSCTFDRQCRSLIDHELRLAQKVPTVETFPGPEFPSPQKKQPWRLNHGIRVFWYEDNPVDLACKSEKIVDQPPGNIPVVYRFERDPSAAPTVETVELPFADAFTLGAVHRRADIQSMENIWNQLFPGQQCPDFASTLEKLLTNGLLYKI